MLLDAALSSVVLVDVQEKLTPLLPDPELLVRRIDWVLRLGKALDIPLTICEQYPKGLGSTVAPLDGFKAHSPCFEKVAFSCCGAPGFMERLVSLGRKQVVLVGIETHVCVLQTALMLLEADYTVFVVMDATGSRKPSDRMCGIERMRHHGAEIITAEMLFFEWLKQSDAPQFRTLSTRFMKEEP